MVVENEVGFERQVLQQSQNEMEMEIEKFIFTNNKRNVVTRNRVRICKEKKKKKGIEQQTIAQ